MAFSMIYKKSEKQIVYFLLEFCRGMCDISGNTRAMLFTLTYQQIGPSTEIARIFFVATNQQYVLYRF